MSKYIAILKAAQERKNALRSVLNSYGIMDYEVIDSKDGAGIIKLKLNSISKIIYIKKESEILVELKKYNISTKC